MPFVSAFAYSGIISLPFIFAIFLLILMMLEFVLTGKSPEGIFGFDLLIILLFLLVVLFSFLINGLGNSLAFNHTVAYIGTFLLFYVAIKWTLFSIKDKDILLKRVLQFLTYATLVSAVYANAEFITSNVFGINLNDYVPRPNAAEQYYDATVLGIFYRARGFAPESGHFTFMMELFSPLTVYYMYFSGFCTWSKLLKALFIIIIIFSIIFGVSSASFVIIPLAILISSVLYAKKIFLAVRKKFRKFVINTSIAVIIILLFNYFFSLYSLILLSLSDKLDSFSFDDRQERIDFFFHKFSGLGLIKKMSGAGPAGFDILGFDNSKAILSLYYSITFELGFLGLLILILLFSYIVISTLKIKNKIGFFLMISLISGMLHFYFIANFWYPWFWFVGVFAIFCSKLYSNSDFRPR